MILLELRSPWFVRIIHLLNTRCNRSFLDFLHFASVVEIEKYTSSKKEDSNILPGDEVTRLSDAKVWGKKSSGEGAVGFGHLLLSGTRICGPSTALSSLAGEYLVSGFPNFSVAGCAGPAGA